MKKKYINEQKTVVSLIHIWTLMHKEEWTGKVIVEFLPYPTPQKKRNNTVTISSDYKSV